MMEGWRGVDGARDEATLRVRVVQSLRVAWRGCDWMQRGGREEEQRGEAGDTT